MLAVLSALAGASLSIAPIGPCNHSLWQVGCVIVLFPSILAASRLFDATSWGFQRLLFIAGFIQAGVIIWLYYLIKKWVHRITAPRRRMGIR